MNKNVCSVEFINDKNLIGRRYFYRCDFEVKVGDKVVAPINVHNKIQEAEVKEIFLSVGDTNELRRVPSYHLMSLSSGRNETMQSPYLVSHLKNLICIFGFRKIGNSSLVNARDLGGLFYDEKHLVAYGNFIRSAIPYSEDISSVGASCLLNLSSDPVASSSCFVKHLPVNFPSVNHFSVQDGADKREEEGEIQPFDIVKKMENIRIYGERPPEDETKKKEEIPYIPAFDIYNDEEQDIKERKSPFPIGANVREETDETQGEKTPFRDKFFAVLGGENTLEVFDFLAQSEGVCLMCDDYGSGAVDVFVTVLYLLVGVSSADIVKDYVISARCMKNPSKQNVNFLNGDFYLDATDEEYGETIKEFLSRYKSARDYLLGIGLSEEKIVRLVHRLQCVEW